MKANISRPLALAIALPAVLALAASCSAPRIVPSPPTSTPAPPAKPLPAPTPIANWRDAPITPGDWIWSMAGNQSVATFANGLLQLRCDPGTGTVSMRRLGSATAPVSTTITTVATTRALTAKPVSAPTSALEITLPAQDPLWDAMAFSRGRFVVDVAGLQPLFVPSWPEVSRVIEDCR